MFNWVRSEKEYQGLMNWLDGQIADLRQHPNTETVLDLYIKYINQRDELLTLGIQRGYKGI